MLFRCFAKQDRLMDVRTDRKAPVKDSRSCSCSQGSTTKWRGDVCGRVECPAPEKSPDLGNSSPDPRAFYVYSQLPTLVAGKRRGRNIYTKRTGNSYDRAGQERDSGWVAAVMIYGRALRIQIG